MAVLFPHAPGTSGTVYRAAAVHIRLLEKKLRGCTRQVLPLASQAGGREFWPVDTLKNKEPAPPMKEQSAKKTLFCYIEITKNKILVLSLQL